MNPRSVNIVVLSQVCIISGRCRGFSLAELGALAGSGWSVWPDLRAIQGRGAGIWLAGWALGFTRSLARRAQRRCDAAFPSGAFGVTVGRACKRPSTAVLATGSCGRATSGATVDRVAVHAREDVFGSRPSRALAQTFCSHYRWVVSGSGPPAVARGNGGMAAVRISVILRDGFLAWKSIRPGMRSGYPAHRRHHARRWSRMRLHAREGQRGVRNRA